MRWFPVMCHAGPISLVFFWGIQMLNSLRRSFTDCSVRRNKKTNVQSLYWSFGLIDISTLTPSTCYKIYFGFTYASSEVHFRSTESQTFYWSIMTADDSIKCRCANSGMTGQVGGFQNPGVCLQAFPSFLPHPLPAFTYAILLCLPQYLDFWFKIWTMATKATSVGSLAL